MKGKLYPVPDLQTLTYDEIEIIEILTGKTLQEAAAGISRGSLSLQRGLQLIAMTRAKPNVDYADLWAELGKIAPGQIEEIEEKADKEAKEDPKPVIPLDSRRAQDTRGVSKNGKSETEPDKSPSEVPEPSGAPGTSTSSG
jgi:hypothetical protein